MVIDFVFEKSISPWDEIEIKSEDGVESKRLEKTSSETRRVQLTDKRQCVYLVKKNIWHEGIEEVLFSIDGIFYNTFDAGRLPYSCEIPIVVDAQNKIIRVPSDIVLVTDTKSQTRWKVATLIQSVSLTLSLAFCTIVFSLVFKTLWAIIVFAGILMALLLLTIITKKAKKLLAMINSCSSH